MYMPARAVERAAGAPERVGPAAAPGSGETILVVEDDARVRRVSLRRLKELGYAVIEADSGPVALAILDRGQPIDLLFTDVVMAGGMNGIELAREAGRRRPGLKTLFTSGYSEPSVIERGLPFAQSAWLGKPHSVAELQVKIRQLLDG
jgi:CheY-like chemotaxis protein